MYLDNAATTKLLPEVVDIVQKYGCEQFYNPSALYGEAIAVNRALNAQRGVLAKALGVTADCIVYTSCGSESDNAALLATRKKKGGRVIVSAAEHAAMYQSAEALRQMGYDVKYCPVDGCGEVIEEEFVKLLDQNTVLVSVMHVNNETGAVNDVRRLCELTKRYDESILFHADGVQAFGHIKVNLRALGVDLYSVSGHKIGAPKGVGALYVKSGVSMQPIVYGGGQESGLRSGTENAIGIAALSACAEKYLAMQDKLREKGAELRTRALDFVTSHEGCKLLSPENGAPHILTMAFERVRGEVMMHELEGYGITVGIGSACSSKKGTARIPKALGLAGGYEMGMVRISINPFDEYDWDYLFEKMHEAYVKLSRFVRV